MQKLSNLLRLIVIKSYGVYFNILAFFSIHWAGKQAFHTFCKVRKGRVKPQQAPYLKSAKHSVERVANHDIQTYQWPGPGPKVLLIHGWESNTFRWRNLISHLSDAGFHIIAFDAPAHGYSSGTYLHVPLYTECVAYMTHKFEPKYAVGHSVGGMTALYYAHKHPEDTVEKIVTIGSPSEFEEIADSYQQLLGFNQRVMRGFDQFIFENFGFHIHEFSTSRFIEGSPKKGLLLHDKMDTIAPFHASQKVHNAWQDSVLIPTEGLGHSMHQKNVNEQIVRFLTD
ncbi:alpha/beta fold hydrolase [Robiginitalea sp. IMCC43444]|uniref:alpha/beta fold hydrolase n=1 Tax=Robiginitalea sp. IMCC43444 TaxID=3459121 RepID=UPI0040424E60